MTQFEYVRPHSRSGMLRLSDAERIADSLKSGSVAVLPTETGYMLAALATSTAAIERVFAVKRRDATNVMHVACSSLQMAKAVGVLDPRARVLLGVLTPGPVTVIVEKTPLLPDRLVALNGTVGIRIPDHPATLHIIGEVGFPLTATSLNESGSEPVPIDRSGLELLNWPSGETVYVVKDDESIVYSRPSTLVRVLGQNLEILRAGPVSELEIQRVASLAGPPQNGESQLGQGSRPTSAHA
jgi:L-threonylcarbamoyladenylate synthase